MLLLYSLLRHMRNSALVMIKISINARDIMEFNTRSLRSLVLNSITSLVLIEILIMTRANYLIHLRKLYSNTPIQEEKKSSCSTSHISEFLKDNK